MSPETRNLFVLLFCMAASAMAIGPPFEMRSVADFKPRDLNLKYRLPTKTRPLEYNIQLQTRIDQGQFGFYGTVVIKIEAVEKTREISLHYRQLLIESVVLKSAEQTIDTFYPEYDKVTEILTLRTKNTDLEPKKEYVLSIKYQGELRKDQGGFYRSSYLNNEGKRVYVFRINYSFGEHFFHY